MSNYIRRLPLLEEARPGRRSGRDGEPTYGRWVVAPGIQGALRASTAEVLICVCTDGEYKEARREDRRAVGMKLPAKQITYLPPPPLALVLPVRVSEEVECG